MLAFIILDIGERDHSTHFPVQANHGGIYFQPLNPGSKRWIRHSEYVGVANFGFIQKQMLLNYL